MISNQNQKKRPSRKEKSEQSSPRRKLYWKILLIILLLAVVLIAIWIFFMRRPAVGLVSVPKFVPPPLKEETFERFEGRYLSFRHNAAYDVKRHEKEAREVGPVLESAFLAEDSTYSKKIALTIESLEGRTIQDSANYNVRKVYPERYREEKLEVGEIAGTVFMNTEDGLFEKVIFIVRKKYLAEIAFTAPLSDNEKLNREFVNIVKSIQWKQ